MSLVRDVVTTGAGLGDTILVVDDEAAVRVLFTRVLRDAGFTVIEAADGIEAIERLDEQPVALMLLDSTMPRLDGAGVIRHARSRPATWTLPIILVTAKGDLEDRVQGLAAGADDYLVKPVAIDELEARVHAQLRGHAAWTQAFEREAAQRRAMTAALRRVPIDGTPEHVARAIVEELVPVMGLDALALASALPDGSIVPLAAAGSWSGRLRLGVALDAGLAARLLNRLSDGPWVVDRQLSLDLNTADGGTVAVIPLTGPAAVFGLLVVSIRVQRDDPREIARRMPLLVELADLAAAALRPVVEAGGDRLRRRAALEAVLAKGAFTPHFQPVVALVDRRVVAYEALTRFDDRVPPDRRFAEAARLGLGHELERATLIAAVKAAGALPATARIGLNVSPEFVLADALPAILTGARQQIVLEITEHAPIADYAELRAALDRIRPPVSVAVDDAGSGYASLRHILALRPAFVKLDLGWVRGIEADPARQALVAGLIHFATEIGCELIGEGIETEVERATLLRLGVPLGQGYLFGRPAPAPAARRSGVRLPRREAARSGARSTAATSPGR